MDMLETARLGEENKQRLRDLYEGVNSGKKVDPSTIFDKNVIVYEPAITPWGGTYEGSDGQEKLGKAQAPWLRRDGMEILGLYADGAHVISKLLVGVVGSDKKVMISEHVTYKDGKVIEMRVFVFDDKDAPLSELFKSK